MDRTSYSEKLRDPRWQKKRLEILQRDDFKCQLCGDTTTTLNVHHEKYHGNPWDVDNLFLVTYCEHCHWVVEHVSDYFPHYVIIELQKINHSTDTEKLIVVTIGINSSDNCLRKLLLYKVEKDRVSFITHLYPWQVAIMQVMSDREIENTN